MDHNYTTRGYITDQNDFVDYENQRQNWFEYIDDNDDQDQASTGRVLAVAVAITPYFRVWMRIMTSSLISTKTAT